MASNLSKGKRKYTELDPKEALSTLYEIRRNIRAVLFPEPQRKNLK